MPLEIIVPGATGALRGTAGRVGPRIRIDQVRKSVGHLPPWRCISLTKGTFYLCGHCFGMLGDGPATSGEEMWMNEQSGAVIPKSVRCEKCGGPCWAAD